MLEQAPGRICGPVEKAALGGACFLLGPVIPWRTHVGAVPEAFHSSETHWWSS